MYLHVRSQPLEEWELENGVKCGIGWGNEIKCGTELELVWNGNGGMCVRTSSLCIPFLETI